MTKHNEEYYNVYVEDGTMYGQRKDEIFTNSQEEIYVLEQNIKESGMTMKIYDVESGEIVQVITTESRILSESYTKRFDGSLYAVTFCQDNGDLYETDNTQYIDLDNLILSVDDGIQEVLIDRVYLQSLDSIKDDQISWDDNDSEKYTDYQDNYYLTTDDGTSPEGFDSILDCVFSVLGL